jgi:hypothetical protein
LLTLPAIADLLFPALYSMVRHPPGSSPGKCSLYVL